MARAPVPSSIFPMGLLSIQMAPSHSLPYVPGQHPRVVPRRTDGAVPPTTHAPCISQDFWTQRIRKIDLGTSETTTLAGPREGYRVWGIAGFKDGDGTSARFFFPQGIAIDPEGTYALVAVRACWPAHRLLAPCRRAYTANPPTSQTAILCLRLALL